MPGDSAFPRTASVFQLRTEEGHLLPVLLVDDLDGTSRLVPEVVTFMQALVSQGESLSKMRGIANTLALLHDYMVIAKGAEPQCPLAPDGLDYRSVMRQLARKQNMLLAHIAGPGAAAPTIGLKEKVAPRRSTGRTFMSPAMVEDLILATPSISQRMTFIQ